jgi:hypothetical protein
MSLESLLLRKRVVRVDYSYIKYFRIHLNGAEIQKDIFVRLRLTMLA